MEEYFLTLNEGSLSEQDTKVKESINRFDYAYVKIFLHGQKYSEYKNIQTKS